MGYGNGRGDITEDCPKGQRLRRTWPFLTDFEWKVVACTVGAILIVEKAERYLGSAESIDCPDAATLPEPHEPHEPRAPPPLEAVDAEAAEKKWWQATLADGANAAWSYAQPRLLSGDGESSHSYEALFFIIFGIVVGTATMYILTFKVFKGIQQTVVLFMLGLGMSLLNEATHFADNTGGFGRGYAMWMRINPHLLLFTMLPPLLAGDAMTIDTAVARRVAKQCLYLAGPGVLIQAMIAAVFLWYYLPFNWPFLLCLTTGSILCATDPVAVIALLKELGAPAKLTVMIQGESLLNDGTAIVLFLIAYRMLGGQSYDEADMLMFMIKTALYAWGCGMCIGFFFVKWITLAADKLNHNSSIVQVTCTLICAYSSFIISEGVFGMSGVLSTVAASLTLAHYMWHSLVEADTMHAFWHMLEYLGNTIIFFLSGCLVGQTLAARPMEDFFHLMMIYIVLSSIRGAFIFGSRPILKFLSPDKSEVSFQDALVMTWGGLRGAVGLALAIQVTNERADIGNGEKISQADGERVMFFVGGFVLLTLAINAQTCPNLVNSLGVARMPASRRRMLHIIYVKICEKFDSIPTDDYSECVVDEINEMLDEVEHHLEDKEDHDGSHGSGGHAAHAGDQHDTLHAHEPAKDEAGKDDNSLSGAASLREAFAMHRTGSGHLKVPAKRQITKKVNPTNEKTLETISQLRIYRKRLEKIPKRMRANVAGLPFTDEIFNSHGPSESDQNYTSLMSGPLDTAMLRTVAEAFMSILKAQYLCMIDDAIYMHNVKEGEILLNSINHSVDDSKIEINDLPFLIPEIGWENDEVQFVYSKDMHNTRKEESRMVQKEARSQAIGQTIGESVPFEFFYLALIIVNLLVIYLEVKLDDTQSGGLTDQQKLLFLIGEIIFTFLYFIEFVVKVSYQRLYYFVPGWNRLDFFLLVGGFVGIVFALAEDNSSFSSVTSIAQANRVMKTVRLIRLVRVFRLLKVMHGRFTKGTHHDFERGGIMQRSNTLECFVRGHFGAQVELKKYVCNHGKVDTPEVARVLAQSTVQVYKALIAIAYERRDIENEFIDAVHTNQGDYWIAEELEQFLLYAHRRGIISAAEAHQLLHPLHDCMKIFTSKLFKIRNGLELHSLDEDDEALHGKDHQEHDVASSGTGEATALIPGNEPQSEPNPAEAEANGAEESSDYQLLKHQQTVDSQNSANWSVNQNDFAQEDDGGEIKIGLSGKE